MTAVKKNKIKDRALELISLVIFTLIIAVISIISMDIIVLPISIFATKNIKLFNFILTDALFFILIAAIAYRIIRKVITLWKDGLSQKEIALYLFKRPFYYFTIFLFFLLSSSFIFLILYLFLSKNYNYIFKMTNS